LVTRRSVWPCWIDNASFGVCLPKKIVRDFRINIAGTAAAWKGKDPFGYGTLHRD